MIFRLCIIGLPFDHGVGRRIAALASRDEVNNSWRDECTWELTTCRLFILYRMASRDEAQQLVAQWSALRSRLADLVADRPSLAAQVAAPLAPVVTRTSGRRIHPEDEETRIFGMIQELLKKRGVLDMDRMRVMIRLMRYAGIFARHVRTGEVWYGFPVGVALVRIALTRALEAREFSVFENSRDAFIDKHEEFRNGPARALFFYRRNPFTYPSAVFIYGMEPSSKPYPRLLRDDDDDDESGSGSESDADDTSIFESPALREFLENPLERTFDHLFVVGVYGEGQNFEWARNLDQQRARDEGPKLKTRYKLKMVTFQTVRIKKKLIDDVNAILGVQLDTSKLVDGMTDHVLALNRRRTPERRVASLPAWNAVYVPPSRPLEEESDARRTSSRTS